MLDTCIMYFLTHIKSISYQKKERKKHTLVCTPSKILVTTRPHFWETCSQDKGQITQGSPRGTLELAGAFRCSLSVFFFFFFFFTTFCTPSFWMTGSSSEDTELCLCTELSLALGLCTCHLLSLSRTPSEPQPTTFQVSAFVLYWEGRAAGLGLSHVPSPGSLACPSHSISSSSEAASLRVWLQLNEDCKLLFKGWGKNILLTIVFLVFTIVPNIQEWSSWWIKEQMYVFFKDMNSSNIQHIAWYC